MDLVDVSVVVEEIQRTFSIGGCVLEVREQYHAVRWAPETVARLWDYYSLNASYGSQYFGKLFGRDIIKFLQRHVPLDGRTILDFGCGPGFVLEELLRTCNNVRVMGVDFSRESVLTAESRLRGLGGFGQVVSAETVPVSLPDQCCDIILMIEVIEHLDDETLQKTLQEASRLLRPGGYFLVTTPNHEDLDASKTACPECGCVFHRWQHVRTWNPDMLASTLEAYGMATQSIMDTLWINSSSSWLSQRRQELGRWLRKKRSRAMPHLAYLGTKIAEI